MARGGVSILLAPPSRLVPLAHPPAAAPRLSRTYSDVLPALPGRNLTPPGPAQAAHVIMSESPVTPLWTPHSESPAARPRSPSHLVQPPSESPAPSPLPRAARHGPPRVPWYTGRGLRGGQWGMPGRGASRVDRGERDGRRT